MKQVTTKAMGLALALALAPFAAKAVEVYNKDGNTVDVGLRYQLQGTLEYSATTNFVDATSTATNTGQNSRDLARIFLFQKQNRIKMNANLEGMLVHFENAMGGESYAGSNNLYNLYELNATFPVFEGLKVNAGLGKRPENNVNAVYDENSLFTSHSQLFNLFQNNGYDTQLYAQINAGPVDVILGTSQGVGNLPERYIPERLQMPVPVFARIGVGNIKDEAGRFLQRGFEKSEGPQFGAHVSGYWVHDSNAGHGSLLGQFATQAEATKGPFVNGNFMFSKNYNPFMNFPTAKGGLDWNDAQFWQASIDSQARLPLGENYLVFGAQWSVAQFVAKYTDPAKRPVINKVSYEQGQITANNGEIYLGLLGESWWLATRLNVFLPDPLMSIKSGANYVSIFGSDPIYELAFPVIGLKVNKWASLTAELEHNFNSTEAIDTDGIYQLKTVPVEATMANFYHNPYAMAGRLMLQVAF